MYYSTHTPPVLFLLRVVFLGELKAKGEVEEVPPYEFAVALVPVPT